MTKKWKDIPRKLKPCPFCAAEADEYAGGKQGFPDVFGVVCRDCGALVEDNVDGEHIRKWNSRAVSVNGDVLVPVGDRQ